MITEIILGTQVIIVFSLVYTIRMVLNWKNRTISELVQKNSKLQVDVDYLQRERDNHFAREPKKEKWFIGASCIHIENLVYGENNPNLTKMDFSLECTSEVTEVSENKIRVKPISVKSSNTKIWNQCTPQDCMDYVEGTWVDKNNAEIIFDEAYRRITTIENIIKNG